MDNKVVAEPYLFAARFRRSLPVAKEISLLLLCKINVEERGEARRGGGVPRDTYTDNRDRRAVRLGCSSSSLCLVYCHFYCQRMHVKNCPKKPQSEQRKLKGSRGEGGVGRGGAVGSGHRCQTILHVLWQPLGACCSLFLLILCLLSPGRAAYKSRHFTCSSSSTRGGGVEGG